MHRQFKGVDDELIARQAEHWRNDISKGKHPEGGNVAFHMPTWLLSVLESRHGLADMPQHQKLKFWKRWGKTPTGRRYTVRGV